MICKLIGVAHKHGEYQGRQYDKLRLYFTKPIAGDEVSGDEFINPKSTYFPTNKLPSLTSDVKEYHDFFDLVGSTFDLSFDQFANIDSIRLVE